MAFLLQAAFLSPKSTEEITVLYKKYRDYLESVKGRIPKAAFSFATADWHYNHEDHRCPHDSWLETLTIDEPASGKRSEIRDIKIHARLLGSHHDGHIELTYEKVKSYSLNTPFEFKMPPRVDVGHGDWLIDEIRLSDNGFVVHEIVFSRGSRWIIECEDILYEWKPIS